MKKKIVQLSFPLLGVDEGFALDAQKPGTTPDAQNVRAFDPADDRARGGQRAGLTKYVTASIGSRVQDICHLAVSKASSQSTTSAAHREIIGVAVAGGAIRTFTTSGIATPGGSPTLSTTAPLIFSSPLFDRLYFTDGANAKYYDGTLDSVENWEAAVAAWVSSDPDNTDDGGEFPKSGSDYPRLIETWRGRIVLAGLKGDLNNWFMSCVGDAFCFNYSPTYLTATQAVAGSVSAAGLVPDIINTIIPHNDDLLYFGCDHSIWRMSGDPMAGGRLDCISSSLGMSWGRPWCKDDAENIYFFSSRGGVYRIAPGSMPEEISTHGIRSRFLGVNLDTSVVRLGWCDRTKGLHVFITPLAATATIHYFWDARLGGWWPDVFGSVSYNPLCVHVIDGDDADDRRLLLGCRDGKIRYFDEDAATDDSTEIESYVYLGPIRLPGMTGIRLYEIQATLAHGSGNLNYQLKVGNSVEAAYLANAQFSGTLSADRNHSIRDRARGDAMWLRLAENTTAGWAVERIVALIADTGRTSQRHF